MHTNFSGRDLICFGDIAIFKNGQISLFWLWTIVHDSPWSSKILIDWNQLKKFMQIEIDVKCMHTNFGGRDLFGFEDIDCYLQKWPNFPFRPWTVHDGPWSSKILIDWNQLKKVMQVGNDVKCIHTNFGGWNFSGFGGIATFMVVKNFDWLESTQKIQASRGWCQVHAHQFWWLGTLRFRRYCYFQKWPNFPFRPWTIVHGHHKFRVIGNG